MQNFQNCAQKQKKLMRQTCFHRYIQYPWTHQPQFATPQKPQLRLDLTPMGLEMKEPMGLSLIERSSDK